jgi:hypothetical protein
MMRTRRRRISCSDCVSGYVARPSSLLWCGLCCMFLDWTNWTFWVTAIALVAFGFCLRDIYEQWRFRKARKNVRDELREVDDLTRLLQAATERLNKLNEPAGSGPQGLNSNQ